MLPGTNSPKTACTQNLSSGSGFGEIMTPSSQSAMTEAKYVQLPEDGMGVGGVSNSSQTPPLTSHLHGHFPLAHSVHSNDLMPLDIWAYDSRARPTPLILWWKLLNTNWIRQKFNLWATTQNLWLIVPCSKMLNFSEVSAAGHRVPYSWCPNLLFSCCSIPMSSSSLEF